MEGLAMDDGSDATLDDKTRAGESSAPRLILLLALALSLVVVAAKFALLPFPVSTPVEFARWLLRWAIVASADLVFIAWLAATCLAFVLVARRTGATRSTRWRRAGRWIVLALFQIAAIYAVVSVPMFRLTMVPLTVELLSFSGGPVLMASSLAGFITFGALTALLVAPLLLGLVAWIECRLPATGARVSSRSMALGIAAFVMVVIAGHVSRVYVEANWNDPNRWERRIAANPHTVFLGSCVEELLKADRLTLSFDPVDVDMSDFVVIPRRLDERENRPAPIRRVSAEQSPRAAGQSEVVPAVAMSSIEVPRTPRRPQNLIVIVLESVGANYLELYGAPYENTPHLAERVARGGMVLENVYAHAASSPKVLVALTASVMPRVDWKLITRDSQDFDVPLLPQVLAERDYRTCYLHSGYWSWKNRDEFLLRRGVDRLVDADNLAAPDVFSWGVSDDGLFDATLAWIDEDHHRPFHALLWTIETHHPYIAGDRPFDFGVDDVELNRYLNAIRNADARIERLMQELERRGLADDTVVAITGDHGEVFGQHGQRVHSFGIYQENVRVPVILLHPSLADRPRRMEDVSQQIDLPATLLGMLHVPRPESWQGRDLLHEGPMSRAYFFSTGNEVLLGLREGNLKYHYHISGGHEELFDLANDPTESQNVAPSYPEKCDEFRRRVGGLVRAQREFLAEHGSR